MIMDAVERDPVLMRKLEIAAAAESIDDKALGSKLRKTIEDACRTLGFVDYARAAEWAAGVDAALDALNGHGRQLAFRIAPDFIALAQIDQQPRLLVGEGAYDA